MGKRSCKELIGKTTDAMWQICHVAKKRKKRRYLVEKKTLLRGNQKAGGSNVANLPHCWRTKNKTLHGGEKQAAGS